MLCITFAAEVFLDWRQRPAEVNQAINSCYERIAKNEKSQWGLYNGPKGPYKDCRFNERQWLLRLKPREQPHAILDIGAGNFGWGRYMADLINNLGVEGDFHIFSIRGEKSNPVEEYQIGNCKMYEFGHFKIEELEREFIKRRFDLQKLSFSLIISSWCFIHLCDPVGTFTQVYKLLEPNGLLVTTGFEYILNDQTPKGAESNELLSKNAYQILVETGSDFLVRVLTDSYVTSGIVVIKNGDRPLSLPLSYGGIEKICERHYVTRLLSNKIYEPKEAQTDEETNYIYGKYYGSSKLLRYLIEYRLLNPYERLIQ